MKKLFKETGIILGGVVLFLAIVFGISFLISSRLHDSPQALYDYAVIAKTTHDALNGETLLNVESIIAELSQDSVENAAELERFINEGIYNSFHYWEGYENLLPGRDTLELNNSLLRESKIIRSCYSDLSFSWKYKQSGNTELSNQYLDEASRTYIEINTLRLQNTTDLNNLLARAEQKLGK